MNTATGLGSAALLALTCGFAPHLASAQIRTDGTLGARTDFRGPDFQINEDLGKRIGDNLFHSFEQFNIRTLADGTIESATFRGAGDLANVISRVTGASPSEINGLLHRRSATPTSGSSTPTASPLAPTPAWTCPGRFTSARRTSCVFPTAPCSALPIPTPAA
jgi:large exoprotein involved in heme utilization and adhesion